jgi:hypothetical protein
VGGVSSELADVWEPDRGIRVDRADPRTQADVLDDLDLLGAGYSAEKVAEGRALEHLTGDGGEWEKELSTRDADRVRLLRRLGSAPEGLMLKTLVSEVVKGQPVGECERIDGSDPDYQFVYRFIRDLEAVDPPLIEKRTTAGASLVTPTLRLLDLISEGITQTADSDDSLLYDRDFTVQYLKATNSITDRGRDLLDGSLHRYIRRIDNYKLLFEAHFAGRRGGDTSRSFTKPFQTRFNSQGRIRKTFARFNQALEYEFERASNGVLCTLTTDPGTYTDPTRPDPRSLYEQISEINTNFNRLLSYFDSDPSTKADTRLDGIPGWTPERDGSVTGRPRSRPSYIKALEFTEKGYPHLHVLFFDVPERESDGMPWLIDKGELSKKWKDYGQGQIVDVYPLTYRDDLDDLGNFGKKKFVTDDGEEIEIPVSEGFVDWYRFGNHGHSDEWVDRNARSHELIDFYNIEDPDDSEEQEAEVIQKTAGAYLGKYLSATLGALLDTSESLEPGDPDAYPDKIATWKLALYWSTNRRFWSLSRDIEKGIERPENIRDPDVRETVRWATIDSLACESRGPLLEDLARRRWDDLDDLRDRLADLLDGVVTPAVESTLPESGDFYVWIDYLGCYAYWDLPGSFATAPELTLSEHEPQSKDDVLGRSTLGENDPPTGQTSAV